MKTDIDKVNKYLKNTKIVKECMLWQGALDTSDGYPRIGYKGNTNTRLHRFIFSTLNSEIDITDKVIRHKCDNIICINPNHLEVGNEWDNMNDRDIRLRSGTAKTNPEDVIKIRELHKTGKYTQKQLGNLFNLNYRTVSYIVNGKTWTWVQAGG